MTPESLLQDLVAIRSESGSEGAIADYVASLATAWGFEVRRQGHNVWFELGQGGGPRLLLCSHLDTVKPCEGWVIDPWNPQWREGRLTGLGANDAKGCVASLLWAAHQLKEQVQQGMALKGTALFAFVAEEEVGGVNGLPTVLPLLGALDAAVVGEPTGFAPCLAQRGMLILACTAHGESAHVAHAQLADNAIHKAARDIARLSTLTFEPHDLLGVAKPQVTLVEGGITRNQVPDRCTFSVDIRTTPNLDHEALAQQLAGELESEVKVHSGRYLPKATDPAHPIARAALAVTGRSAIGSPTTSDWAFLGALPTVKLGPGDTHRSHRPNEYLTSQELQGACEGYARLVTTYFDMAKGV